MTTATEAVRQRARDRKIAQTLDASVVEITPELAQHYLTKNTNNRPLRRDYVLELASSMRRGEWQLNGESIKISKSDRLLDGQHRLSAVIESKVSVSMVVIGGLDDTSFTTIDMNKKRTTADALAIAGYPNEKLIAAAVRLILILAEREAHLNTRGSYSPIQIKEWCDAYYEELQQWIPIAKQLQRANMLEPAMVVALAYEFGQKNVEDTKVFLSRLADGMGLDEKNPIYCLRQALMQNATSLAKLPRAFVVALTIRAWNLYRRGHTTSVDELLRVESSKFPTIV